MAKRSGPKWVDVPLVEVPAVADPRPVTRGSGPPSKGGPPVADAVAALLMLPRVRDELRALDERRRVLLATRDLLVVKVRADGAPWSAVEALSGVSRPALLKRAAGDSSCTDDTPVTH